MFESFLYSRAALADGEYWRLATATLAHLSSGHLLLNVFGLALVVALLLRRTRPPAIVAAFLFSALAATLGVHLATSLDWYGGASSATLGLLAWGLTRLRWPLAGLLIAVMLGGALLDLGRAQSLLGEPLAPQAHLAGIIGGLLWGALGALVARARPRQAIRY